MNFHISGSFRDPSGFLFTQMVAYIVKLISAIGVTMIFL